MRIPIIAPLILALIALPSCDSDVHAPPVIECETWADCDGGLVLTIDIVEGAFGKPAGSKLVRGDSIRLRGRIENRSNLPTDSIVVVMSALGIPDIRQHELRLDPGTSYSFVETAVVSDFTFGGESRLSAQAHDLTDPYEELRIRIGGELIIPLARSGYQFEVFPMPGARSTLTFAGWTFHGLRIRHRTPIALRALVTNSYDVDLPPIGMGVCFWDFDHCYIRHESADSTPVLQPGSTAYLEMEFELDTQGRYFDWWSQRLLGLSICSERSYSGNQCGSESILIIANYEKDCTVRDAIVGSVMQAVDHDCGYDDDGSAHRFIARAGERYRLTHLSGSGSMFLTDADGAPDNRFGPREMTIPRDGTYYVVALHRSPQTFLLERLP